MRGRPTSGGMIAELAGAVPASVGGSRFIPAPA
jgi:hypothetical protein